MLMKQAKIKSQQKPVSRFKKIIWKKCAKQLLMAAICTSFAISVYSRDNTATEQSFNAEKLNSVLRTTPLYSGKTAGVWFWDVTSILQEGGTISNSDALNVKAFIQFCQKKQITEVYLQIKHKIPVVKYQYFVSNLQAASVTIGTKKYHITVQALNGGSNWVAPDGVAERNAFLEWVFAYQKNATKAQRFTAVHFDVEPYTHTLWKSDLAAGILAYQNFVVDVSKRIADKNASEHLNLSMVVDIPFWFDKRQFNNSYGQGNLAEWVYQRVPTIAIMSYRTKVTGARGGIFDIVKDELAYGKKYGKRTIVSAEVSARIPKEDSFSNDSTMRAVLNGVVSAIDKDKITSNANYSFAIHDYKNLRDLPLSPP